MATARRNHFLHRKILKSIRLEVLKSSLFLIVKLDFKGLLGVLELILDGCRGLRYLLIRFMARYFWLKGHHACVKLYSSNLFQIFLTETAQKSYLIIKIHTFVTINEHSYYNFEEF